MFSPNGTQLRKARPAPMKTSTHLEAQIVTTTKEKCSQHSLGMCPIIPVEDNESLIGS